MVVGRQGRQTHVGEVGVGLCEQRRTSAEHKDAKGTRWGETADPLDLLELCLLLRHDLDGLLLLQLEHAGASRLLNHAQRLDGLHIQHLQNRAMVCAQSSFHRVVSLQMKPLETNTEALREGSSMCVLCSVASMQQTMSERPCCEPRGAAEKPTNAHAIHMTVFARCLGESTPW
eukprot:scaffold227790_cov28-Tisochrysis_lutea.AAC.1